MDKPGRFSLYGFNICFMKCTYLLINLFTILIPAVRSAEPKLQFNRKLKYFFPGMIFTAIFFIVWDYFKTRAGVWGFNDKYILGIKFFGLPIEEFLFFITVPYACTFIYEAITIFFGSKIRNDKGRYVLLFLSACSLTVSFLVLGKAYTFSVLFIGGLVFPIVTLLMPGSSLNIFFITYLISLVPMAVVNGLLTALPVVTYDDTQNLGIRIGTIPVEDFVYAAILLSMNISLYQWQKNGKPSLLNFK